MDPPDPRAALTWDQLVERISFAFQIVSLERDDNRLQLTLVDTPEAGDEMLRVTAWADRQWLLAECHSDDEPDPDYVFEEEGIRWERGPNPRMNQATESTKRLLERLRIALGYETTLI